MDWDSDPQLKALREEFIASFESRGRAMEREVARLGVPQTRREGLDGLCGLSHKLAGAAESYGFASLTEAAAALEDWISFAAETELSEPGRAERYAGLLVEMLDAARLQGRDEPRFAADERLRDLRAAAARAVAANRGN